MARNGIDYLLALEMSDARRTALAIIFSEQSREECGMDNPHFDWDLWKFHEDKE